jgi:hypothetical protein
MTSCAEPLTFWVTHYKFVFTMGTFWVSKDAEFHVESKIINFP